MTERKIEWMSDCWKWPHQWLSVTWLWWWWRQTWQFYLVLIEFEMRRRLANKSCLEWAGCDNFNHNNINYWLEGAAEHDIKLFFAQNSMKTYNEGTVEKMPEIHRLRKLICSYIDLVQAALLFSKWLTPTHSRFIIWKHGPAILSRKSYAIWSIIWSIPSTIKSSVNWNRSTYLGGSNGTNTFTTKPCVNCYFLLRAGIEEAERIWLCRHIRRQKKPTSFQFGGCARNRFRITLRWTLCLLHLTSVSILSQSPGTALFFF